MFGSEKLAEVREIVAQHLKPLVAKIDVEGLYPGEFLQLLGQKGHFSGDAAYNIRMIEEVAHVCSSSAFVLWCQLMAVYFLRNGQSETLKKELLPQLERGEVFGGTGLSNPMKFYGGLEPLRLKATKTADGYRINGTLPFVSNLGEAHWFAVVFQAEAERRVMALLPCQSDGLTLTELDSFLGMNGTATYSCEFQDVFVPFDYVLSEAADRMVQQVRPYLVLMQIGMALGLVQAGIAGIKRLAEQPGGANSFLPVQPDDLERRLAPIREQVHQVAEGANELGPQMKEIFRLRLASAYLALDTAGAGMLHSGGAAYVFGHPASRRLREAYFYALITPSVKQLEKVIQKG